jgi:hypothetical protein
MADMKLQHELKQAAIAEIERIATAHGGRFTADQVVDAAKDPSSPLHEYFEWSDDVAAHRYRLSQARALVQQCKIEAKVAKRKVAIRQYVRDPEVDSTVQGYVAITAVRKEQDLALEVVTREFMAIGSALKRARRLASYFGLEGELDEIEVAVGAAKSRLEQFESDALGI